MAKKKRGRVMRGLSRKGKQPRSGLAFQAAMSKRARKAAAARKRKKNAGAPGRARSGKKTKTGGGG